LRDNYHPLFLFFQQDSEQVGRLSVSEIPPQFRRGSNPAPAKRDFTSDFKSIKVFNGRTRNAKGVEIFNDSSTFCFIETEKDSDQERRLSHKVTSP